MCTDSTVYEQRCDWLSAQNVELDDDDYQLFDNLIEENLQKGYSEIESRILAKRDL